MLYNSVQRHDLAIELNSNKFEIWMTRAWSLYTLEKSFQNYDVLSFKPAYLVGKNTQEKIKKKLSKSTK